jgi:pimeloyl-ACP methyl ester carboxylesterase
MSQPSALRLPTLLAVFAAALLVAPSAWALNPSRTYKQLPDKFNMKYEAHVVKTADGASLKAWTFPAAEKSSRVLLIAHNGEGNMADYLRRADAFTRAGWTVVMFDWRGFGESSEFEIDNNMFVYPHFQADLEVMFDFCRKQYAASFDVYGWGIGGGLALGVGFHRAEARKIIADTPFLSMEDLEERFSRWDEPMEVPFAGYDKRNEPKTAVTQAPGKSLEGVKLIVGSNDVLMKPADMKALVGLDGAASKKIDKEIYVVENPDRKDNYRVDKAGYIEQIVGFLKAGKTAAGEQ